MKSLLQRNPLLAFVAIAVLAAITAAGHALVVDHGGRATVAQAQPSMLMPF